MWCPTRLVQIKVRRGDQEKASSSRLRLPENKGTNAMLRYLLRVFVVYTIAIIVLASTACADDQPANRSIQEEVWAIPVTLPTIAYVVRPVGDGPFPLIPS
jgi:hypothetical protein